MYVLEHSTKWWHEKCKIRCPDCETKLYEEGDVHPFMDILEQSRTFWSRHGAANYDIQYHATFECKRCGCKFKTWSYIIKGAGPPINIKLDVEVRPWAGTETRLV